MYVYAFHSFEIDIGSAPGLVFKDIRWGEIKSNLLGLGIRVELNSWVSPTMPMCVGENWMISWIEPIIYLCWVGWSAVYGILFLWVSTISI